MKGDWFDKLKQKIQVLGTSDHTQSTTRTRSIEHASTRMVPENRETGTRKRTRTECLAAAIDNLLHWQENGMRLKAEARERAMLQRTRKKTE